MLWNAPLLSLTTPRQWGNTYGDLGSATRAGTGNLGPGGTWPTQPV